MNIMFLTDIQIQSRVRRARPSHSQPVDLSITQSFWKSVYQIRSRIQKQNTTKTKDKKSLISFKPVIPLPGLSSKEILILAESVFNYLSLMLAYKLHKGSSTKAVLSLQS